jgi:hypothetical protein
LVPDHAPPAAHDVEFVADHDSVVPLPATTVLGDAVKDTEGSGSVTETVADCDAVAEGPWHVKT